MRLHLTHSVSDCLRKARKLKFKNRNIERQVIVKIWDFAMNGRYFKTGIFFVASFEFRIFSSNILPISIYFFKILSLLLPKVRSRIPDTGSMSGRIDRQDPLFRRLWFNPFFLLHLIWLVFAYLVKKRYTAFKHSTMRWNDIRWWLRTFCAHFEENMQFEPFKAFVCIDSRLKFESRHVSL